MTIKLYTWGTPNGRKVSIMLEELKAPYEVYPINIMKDEQFKPSFLALDPNNKIPVIVDTATSDGSPFVLFESGAILIYLAGKYQSDLLPLQVQTQLTVVQWLMFQMGAIGPMFGQLHHLSLRSLAFAAHEDLAALPVQIFQGHGQYFSAAQTEAG